MGHLLPLGGRAQGLVNITSLIITKDTIICSLHMKNRPQREQVTCPGLHSWEATEPGQTLWARATLERMLVGKPFSTEQRPWSKSHRRLFNAAKLDVNQGEPRARQALLTARRPRPRVRPGPAAGFGAGVLPGVESCRGILAAPGRPA